MEHAQESSLQFQLAALRSLVHERQEEERAEARVAEAVRQKFTRLAEQVFFGVERGRRARVDAERAARQARDHQRRVDARAQAERARVLRELERDRELLESEMEVEAALAAQSRPTGMLALLAALVIGLVALAAVGHGQHRRGQALLQEHAQKLGAVNADVERSLAEYDEQARHIRETNQRLLAERAEAERRAAREAAAAAEAERLAALERQRQAERVRLAKDRERRERERRERERRARWESLTSAECLADPLCGLR